MVEGNLLSPAIAGAPNGGGPASNLHYSGSRRRGAGTRGFGAAIGCHTFRAMGITAYLKNGGRVEVAQRMARHSNAKTTGFL